MGRLLRPDGEKMKALRLQKGWPREQLAQIAGISARKIRRVEAGGNESFETLRAVAGAFGLEVHELMRGTSKDAGGATTGKERILQLLSAETFAALLAWWMPYAPAAKGLMATFAMIVVAASAIALTPLLVDRDADSMIVDSSQSYSPAPSVHPSGRTETMDGRQSQSAVDVRVASPRSARSGKAVSTGRSEAPPALVKNAASMTDLSDPYSANYPGPSSLPQAGPAAGAVQTIVGVIHNDWLKNLAQPVSTSMVTFLQTHSKAVTVSSSGRPAEPGGRGGGGGYGIFGRPFVKSGKTTAAFFSKVGSSIKRAF